MLNFFRNGEEELGRGRARLAIYFAGLRQLWGFPWKRGWRNQLFSYKPQAASIYPEPRRGAPPTPCLKQYFFIVLGPTEEEAECSAQS